MNFQERKIIATLLGAQILLGFGFIGLTYVYDYYDVDLTTKILGSAIYGAWSTFTTAFTYGFWKKQNNKSSTNLNDDFEYKPIINTHANTLRV